MKRTNFDITSVCNKSDNDLIVYQKDVGNNSIQFINITGGIESSLLSNLSDLEILDVSFNANITFHFSVNKMANIFKVYLDFEIINNIFDMQTNERVGRKNKMFTYLKAMYVITNNNLT